MNMTFLDIIVPGQSRRPRIPRRVIDTAEQVKKEVADTAVQVKDAVEDSAAQLQDFVAGGDAGSDDNSMLLWSIIQKIRGVTVQGWTTASADFVGCNFSEIADFLKKNGHKVPDDIKPGQSLRSISFTGTEKMLFYYSDGSADVSAYRFNGKSFTYRWDNDKMGFTFLTDQATVEYLDGKCILTIRASIQDSTTSGSVTFVLSPMD